MNTLKESIGNTISTLRMARTLITTSHNEMLVDYCIRDTEFLVRNAVHQLNLNASSTENCNFDARFLDHDIKFLRDKYKLQKESSRRNMEVRDVIKNIFALANRLPKLTYLQDKLSHNDLVVFSPYSDFFSLICIEDYLRNTGKESFTGVPLILSSDLNTSVFPLITPEFNQVGAFVDVNGAGDTLKALKREVCDRFGIKKADILSLNYINVPKI